jgi:hypothetical protein
VIRQLYRRVTAIKPLSRTRMLRLLGLLTPARSSTSFLLFLLLFLLLFHPPFPSSFSRDHCPEPGIHCPEPRTLKRLEEPLLITTSETYDTTSALRDGPGLSRPHRGQGEGALNPPLQTRNDRTTETSIPDGGPLRSALVCDPSPAHRGWSRSRGSAHTAAGPWRRGCRPPGRCSRPFAR